MKMYILGKRFIKFPDKDIVAMEEEINVFDVYQEIRSFTAHLIKEEFDSDDCPEEIRCLHNILSFIFGEYGNFFFSTIILLKRSTCFGKMPLK